MNTRKIIAAVVAVLVMLTPVTVVRARHTEDTYYMQYAEGQELGSITYADITLPVLYGIEQSTVDTGNVELFGLSATDHLIMLSHSDAGFSKLYENSQIGTKINVVLNNNSTWYEVFNTYWIAQTDWESEQNLRDFYYADNTPLTLVTCNHRGGVRGRWVVQCTYSSEPARDVVIEDVVYLPAETDIILAVEEVETPETIEETPDVNITPLNLLKMQKAYTADYIRFYRGF